MSWDGSGTNPLMPGESASGKLGPGQPTVADQAVRMLLGQAGAPTAETALAAAGDVGKGDWQGALGNIGLTAAGLAPMFVGPIRGFHGTPHTFEPVEGNPFGEFRDEAIGSGEGAQAYGWGHYVAGNPKVAEGYQNQLSGHGQITINGNNYSLLDPRKAVESEFPDIVGNNQIAYPIQFMMNDMRQGLDLPAAINNMKYNYSHFAPENTLQAEKLFTAANPQISSGGHLLEVHILPEESQLLDWDKPYSQQPPRVQQALAGMDSGTWATGSNDPTGEMLYKTLSQQKTYEAAQAAKAAGQMYFGREDQAASQALHSAGIPGLRYLDAGSRNISVAPLEGPSGTESWQVFDNSKITRGGEGQLLSSHPTQAEAAIAADKLRTRNYVIFHPSNLRIVSRDGTPLTPVDHDPFAGGSP